MTDAKKDSSSSEGSHDVSRRQVVTAGGLFAAALGTACSKPSPSGRAAPPAPELARVAANIVRVTSVPTAVEGNLLPTLVEEFAKQSSLRVELKSDNNVYGLARSGMVDLAISHYGHKNAEAFVMDGYGDWPRTLFSNQMALLGPPSDPAGIRHLQDAGEAFRRIAASKSLFVVNHIDGVRYLIEILWNAAGRPDRSGWLLDEGRQKDAAITYAAERGAYSVWGLTPFLRLQRQTRVKLEPLVLGDPLLQRMLVSIVVKASRSPSVNTAGAEAFQTFLLSPATQARVRDVGYPGVDGVQWVPGGRHNRTGFLPLS